MTDSDTPRGRGPALAVASAGYFFVLLDVTIVNVALARIGSGLGSSRSELQWVVDAYALVLAAGMLGAGDLADRTGSRRLFLAGLAAFGGASALCAAAPDAGVLIGARAVQGVGAAAILPSSLAIVNQLFPDPAERPRAIGVWAGLGGSALVLGPILGAVLVGPLGWRAIFWLNVPLVIGALAGGFATLPEGSRQRARGRTGQDRRSARPPSPPSSSPLSRAARAASRVDRRSLGSRWPRPRSSGSSRSSDASPRDHRPRSAARTRDSPAPYST